MLEHNRTFAWINRLPRPLLRWFAALACLWHLFLTDVLAQFVPHMEPSDIATRATVFGFAGAIYGIREIGKVKGAP